MMQELIKKYAAFFEPRDLIKMIHKKVEKAEDLCKEHDPKYMEFLATAHDLLTDYFTAKGVDIRTIPRS